MYGLTLNWGITEVRVSIDKYLVSNISEETRSQQDTQLNSEIKTTNIKFGKRTGFPLGFGFNDLRPQVTRGKKGGCWYGWLRFMVGGDLLNISTFSTLIMW